MIIMGHVVNAFGIRGWVRIYPYTEYVDSLLNFKTWWLGKGNKQWNTMQVVTGRINGNLLDVKLIGCDDRDHALKLKGLQIAVPREALPLLPDNGDKGYYWSDLIGCEVITLNNEILGFIVGLIETGADDVLCVQDKTNSVNEILIPFIEPRFIKKVDLTNRRVVVDWEIDY
ncbi:MAG: ribosome maturation factor RimM [Nitrosomonas sp.]|nr:ribosome maturation factor RimM [Nitrosomonas sp.]